MLTAMPILVVNDGEYRFYAPKIDSIDTAERMLAKKELSFEKLQEKYFTEDNLTAIVSAEGLFTYVKTPIAPVELSHIVGLLASMKYLKTLSEKEE